MKIEKTLHNLLNNGYLTTLIITVSLVFYAILRKFKIIDFKSIEDGLGIPLDVLIPTLIIATIYLFHFIFIVVRYLQDRRFNLKSVFYTSVKYSWTISEEGNFEARNIYNLKNSSDKNLNTLPVEGFVWFSNPDKDDTRFRIIWKEGRKQYKFEKVIPKTNKILDRFLLSYNKKTYSFSWSPNILPPLAPNEELTYQVEIFTPQTEMAAFTNKGTHMGFPITMITNKIYLNCRAPKGHKFVFMTPSYIVVDLAADKNFPEIEELTTKPILSEDECFIEWRIDNPKLNKRYWINYKLIKIEEDTI